jgi:hypothetical protein
MQWKADSLHLPAKEPDCIVCRDSNISDPIRIVYETQWGLVFRSVHPHCIINESGIIMIPRSAEPYRFVTEQEFQDLKVVNAVHDS